MKLLLRLISGAIPVGALFVLLLVSLHLLSIATQDSAEFGRLYSWLLLLNALGLTALITLIGGSLYRLLRQHRARVAGARLTLRLVITFVLLAVVPVTVVYYYSLQFLHRGIDSWFDVRVEQALEDALDLGRSSLDFRIRDALRQTQMLAAELIDVPDALAALALNDLRSRSGASELILLAQNGRVIASSSAEPTAAIIPNLPTEGVLLQLRQGGSYASLDPIRDAGLHVRAAVLVPPSSQDPGVRFLQALFPVPERLDQKATSVQSAYAQYKELVYLRGPLKYSFTLTLSLALLFSVLAAVWGAFFSARRLVAPIRELAEGTRAVAAGNYDKRLPPAGHDDLGFLVQSFNEMTRRIAKARADVQHSREQAESQKAYLEAVLGRLSSGVLVLDIGEEPTLRMANAAAGQVFGIDLTQHVGASLRAIAAEQPMLGDFIAVAEAHLPVHGREWREEITLPGPAGRQILMCRGTSLPGTGDRPAGYVIVFDDITALIQAQRDAAWGEVARRLAHEIKNPLTPIQLAAERLRHKYLRTMEAKDAELLDRSTHTIVQQVETMKEMVNAFAEYARAPKLQLGPLDLNRLVSEVLDLYRGADAPVHLVEHLCQEMPRVEADPGRLRQLLHNVIKNAVEAIAGQPGAMLTVSTQCVQDADLPRVELCIEDNGPGFPEDMLGQIFEPYVTTKHKGTGLGLAIVKKIVEEHGGVITGENLPQGGARITIRLPLLGAAGGHAAAARSWADTGTERGAPQAG